jgi:TRAP-type C4-dicarboxylate transport system permease small subunit
MKLLHWIDEYAEQAIIILVTLSMLVMLSLQVITRYVINASISWTEELSIFGMVWLAYFGVSLAAKQRRHIRITIIADMFSPKNKKGIEIAANAIFIAFLAFLVYGTWNMTILALETKQVASASGFPRWIGLLGLPLALGLTIFRLARDSANLIREYRILAVGGTVAESAPVISLDMEE